MSLLLVFHGAKKTSPHGTPTSSSDTWICNTRSTIPRLGLPPLQSGYLSRTHLLTSFVWFLSSPTSARRMCWHTPVRLHACWRQAGAVSRRHSCLTSRRAKLCEPELAASRSTPRRTHSRYTQTQQRRLRPSLSTKITSLKSSCEWVCTDGAKPRMASGAGAQAPFTRTSAYSSDKGGMTMRLLFICHSHPDLQAGGTEIFSRDLFRELRRASKIDGAYLAGTSSGQRPQSPGTAFQAVGNQPDEL